MTRRVSYQLGSLLYIDATVSQVIDELEPLVAEGGVVLDWHTCDIFPERWIDLVVVLRCDHSVLWERLEMRWVSKAYV